MMRWLALVGAVVVEALLRLGWPRHTTMVGLLALAAACAVIAVVQSRNRCRFVQTLMASLACVMDCWAFECRDTLASVVAAVGGMLLVFALWSWTRPGSDAETHPPLVRPRAGE